MDIIQVFIPMIFFWFAEQMVCKRWHYCSNPLLPA